MPSETSVAVAAETAAAAADLHGRSGDTGNGGERSMLGKVGWPLGPSGLAFDREWAVVDHRNRALRLKQVCAYVFVHLRNYTRMYVIRAPACICF